MIEAPGKLNDELLLSRMMTGDAQAFEELYERRQGAIYRFALRMSGSEAVAEDVTQEVFMALINDGNQYDPARGAVSAYLFGIARHKVLRRLQKDRAFVSMSDETAEEETTRSDEKMILNCDPLTELTRNEIIESVRGAILSLPVHYREVIILCNLEEMNYSEAADALGCAVGTVRSRLHRARALLIEKLRLAGRMDSSLSNSIPARYVL